MENNFNLKEFIAANKAKKSVDFPVDAFPAGYQYIMEATNASLNYPIDLMGVSMLNATALATGNTHKVQVRNEWIESAVLYIAVVGRPGTAKSHPLNFALKPFIKHDQASLKVYEQQKQEYERYHSLSKEERRGLPEPVKPTWQKYLVQDHTPEALLDVHKFNRRGLGIYMDELMGFFKNFGRYSNGGGDQEFWLSAWSGKAIIQDRKSGEPTMISEPFISVIGTIQVGLLQSLAKDNRNQNGFLDRILFAFPENLKKEYWNNVDLCPTIAEDWAKYLVNLLERKLEVKEDLSLASRILQYTPEASQLLWEWQKYNTDLVNTAPTESLAGVYTKLEVYCIRLSLILQMAAYTTEEAERDFVEVDAVIGAIKLIEYFRHTRSLSDLSFGFLGFS